MISCILDGISGASPSVSFADCFGGSRSLATFGLHCLEDRQLLPYHVP